jgi:hypothetical protein
VREAVNLLQQLTDKSREIIDAAWEQGHTDGESCRQADWNFALSEYCELPPDVDSESAEQVARYIARLQSP